MKWIQSETNILQNSAHVKAIWYFRYRNVIAFFAIFFFLAKEGQFFWYLIYMTPWEIIHFPVASCGQISNSTSLTRFKTSDANYHRNPSQNYWNEENSEKERNIFVICPISASCWWTLLLQGRFIPFIAWGSPTTLSKAAQPFFFWEKAPLFHLDICFLN